MSFDIDQSFLKTILESSIGDVKHQYADIYLSNSQVNNIKLDDKKIEIMNSGVDQGVGFRLTDFNRTAYSYSNEINENKIKQLADEARQIIRADKSANISFSKNVVNDGDFETISEISVDDKVELLKKCEKAARSEGTEIRQVTINYFDSRKNIRILNTDGIDSIQTLNFVRLIIQVVAVRNEITQIAFETPGLQVGANFFEIYNVEDLGRKVAKSAIKMLDSKPAPSGPMQVILAAGSGGVIFHEATGHGLEADAVDKHSVYKNKINDRIAADCVNLVDDPSKSMLWGSYRFDDEGTVSRPTVLIENGILRNYLCDKINGKKIGLLSTGNGRRESYMHPPIPRMSNTYLMPGKMTKEEVISSTKKGLYAKKLGGGQVDPQSGDFVFSVTEGYLVENGKITSPVRGATLVGSGPQTLFNIDMVANDLDHEPGTCGKDGQAAPVTTGQPTIRISNMIVGGTDLG